MQLGDLRTNTLLAAMGTEQPLDRVEASFFFTTKSPLAANSPEPWVEDLVEMLRYKIMGVEEGDILTRPKHHYFKLENHGSDALFIWANKWVKIGKRNASTRTSSIQELLRYALTSNFEPDWYYSFCRDTWVRAEEHWHCVLCKDCKTPGYWHCKICNKCTEGVCDGCGGVSRSH